MTDTETFLLAGRYFEARSSRRSGNALRSLAAVGAREVAVLDAAGREERLPVAALEKGDRFVVRPGETVATDGDVVFGQSALDRSAMQGLLGTVAGDDTVLLVVAEDLGGPAMVERLQSLIEPIPVDERNGHRSSSEQSRAQRGTRPDPRRR